MSYNYSKLKGRIIEVYGNYQTFSKKIGITTECFSRKINNKNQWKQNEIAKTIDCLNLSESDIPSYFFNCEVQGTKLL